MAESAKNQVAFDPRRNPLSTPAMERSFIKHEEAGLLMVNNSTLVIEPIPDQPYPGHPIKVPKELMAVDQPFVHVCGYPSGDSERPDGSRGAGRDLGCETAVGGGCPILQHYGRVGPVNLIVMKNGKIDSARCHHVYCGISGARRPTQQVHMLESGWTVLTDRTKIPLNVYDKATNTTHEQEVEVPDLAPFYEEMKVGRFAQKPEPRPKRKYTKRKGKRAHREGVAAAREENGQES